MTQADSYTHYLTDGEQNVTGKGACSADCHGGQKEQTPRHLACCGQQTLEHPIHATPGTRAVASTIGAPEEGGRCPHGLFILGFDTAPALKAGRDAATYEILSTRVTLMTSSNFEVIWNPSQDPVFSYLSSDPPQVAADEEPGRPLELFGAGFRNDYTPLTWTETAPYAPTEDERNGYPVAWTADGAEMDASMNVNEDAPYEVEPFAAGTIGNHHEPGRDPSWLGTAYQRPPVVGICSACSITRAGSLTGKPGWSTRSPILSSCRTAIITTWGRRGHYRRGFLHGIHPDNGSSPRRREEHRPAVFPVLGRGSCTGATAVGGAGYGQSHLLVTVLVAVLGGTRATGGFGRVLGLILALLILQTVASGLNLLRVNANYANALGGGILLVIMALNRWLR